MDKENQFNFLCIARKRDGRISFCLCRSLELGVILKHTVHSISVPFTYEGVLRATYKILEIYPNAHSLVLVNGIRFSQKESVLKNEGQLTWEIFIKFSDLKERVVATTIISPVCFVKFETYHITSN